MGTVATNLVVLVTLGCVAGYSQSIHPMIVEYIRHLVYSWVPTQISNPVVLVILGYVAGYSQSIYPVIVYTIPGILVGTHPGIKSGSFGHTRVCGRVLRQKYPCIFYLVQRGDNEARLVLTAAPPMGLITRGGEPHVGVPRAPFWAGAQANSKQSAVPTPPRQPTDT